MNALGTLGLVGLLNGLIWLGMFAAARARERRAGAACDDALSCVACVQTSLTTALAWLLFVPAGLMASGTLPGGVAGAYVLGALGALGMVPMLARAARYYRRKAPSPRPSPAAGEGNR